MPGRQVILPLAALVGLLVTWEGVVWGLHVSPIILPGPRAIARTLVTTAGPIAYHAWHTLRTTLLGFGLAVGLGLLLGFAVGLSTTLRDLLYPLLVGFNSIPKAAMVPLFVMWFGVGQVPAVLTAFAIAFFPVAVNIATSLATLEPELRNVLRSFGATRWQAFVKVGLPRAMPTFFASLKIAVSAAFVGSVIAETVAADAGIGYLMAVAASDFNTSLGFCGLLVLAAMGTALYGIFVAIERKATRWAYSD